MREFLGEDLGRTTGTRAVPSSSAAEPTPRQLHRARRLRDALAIAARHAPWRSDCYPKALAAHLFLRLTRTPFTTHFGLRRDDAGSLRAHAWVDVGGVVITGASPERWQPVGSFTWLPRGRR